MQVPNADHHQQPNPINITTLASAADDDPLKGLSLDFLNLFSTGHNTAFSDVIFCVEGKQVHAHRCILAARSSFFRMVFCKGIDTNYGLTDASNGMLRPDITCLPVQVPVGFVSYDVLLIVLQFLYSGQLILAFQQGRSKCPERGCWHAHCSAHIDLALETLHAAMFFGVDQLSTMIQRHVGSIIAKISIDDVMRVLVTARKQGLGTLWTTCSELVARSGLAMETLKKHLPQEIATDIEEIRMQRCQSRRNDMLYHINSHSCSPPLSSIDRGAVSPMPAARNIHKMQQALDSLDVELVRLMVMGEGLDLDSAHALHYSVGNCSRDVVKAMLEMGAVNVNHPDHGGRTALHVACEMANPDMISVLLDHHASPLLRADTGDTPIDMIKGLISASQMGSPMHQNHDHNRLRLCLELLQSAAYVADKEDESSDGAVTEPSSDNTSTRSLYLQHHNSRIDIPDCSSSFEPVNACANAAMATPISLSQDWATIESCPFEQNMLTSTDQLEAKHHYQLHDQDHHPSSAVLTPRREAALSGSRGESIMRDMITNEKGASSNMNGMIYDNFMRTHLQLPASAPLKYTISSSAHESFSTTVISTSSMDDYLYPDFRDIRMVCTPGTLAPTVFANPNSSTLF